MKVWQKDGTWFGQLEGTCCPNLKLTAKNESEAIIELQLLQERKEAGLRTIVETDLVEVLGSNVVPILWSVVGECYTGTVANRDGQPCDFWGKTLEDFQVYMITASESGGVSDAVQS